jgi:hypothetical protein
MRPYNRDASSLAQFRPTQGAHWEVRLHDHRGDASDIDGDYLTVVQYHEAAVTVDRKYFAGAPRMKATASEARYIGETGRRQRRRPLCTGEDCRIQGGA